MRKIVLLGLGICVAILFLLLPFSSELPDGLMRIIKEHNGEVKSPLLLKGILGVLIAFVFVYFIGLILEKRHKD